MNLYLRKTALVLCLGMATLSIHAQTEPYKNPDLSPAARAEDLLGRLTLKEKISLMMNSSPAVDRLGIKPYGWWNEALHGVARNGLATVYPITMGMASAFDAALVEQVYTTVSDEARAKFHDARKHGRYGRQYEGLTFWTPNVNIFRDPRWGRGQETWGEDPYLTSRLGVAVVKGLQGPADAKYDKLHACAKHFAVHSGPEALRHTFNVEDLNPRDLWETYLPAFKALVQEADVKEVMCAYQRFDGQPCCGSNRLLQQILREEWGYKHLVVSDCGAISDFFLKGHHETQPNAAAASADAVTNGTDLECGGEYAHLDEAVEKGLISEERIDTSLRRLLEARFALGEMDPDAIVPWSRISIDTVDCSSHRGLALDAARKSMVLLHNNGTLPLSKVSARKIVVMGPNAVDSVMQWGNYSGKPSHTITILDGIRQKLGDVAYERGCGLLESSVLESYYDQISHDGTPGMKGTYWNNLTMEGEAVATQELPTPIDKNNGGNTVFAPGVKLQNFTAVYEGTFRPAKTARYHMNIEGDDGYRVYINGDRIMNRWGKHTIQKSEYVFEATAGQAYDIKIEYMQADDDASLKFDLGIPRQIKAETIVDKVKDAETVIFVGGISPSLEGEEMNHVNYAGFAGGDRTSIELPQVQRDLLRTLKQDGKRVVFVNCSGSAMALSPEVESCDAILQAWYPGQAGGQAVADVLFGDYNPSGKLPVTFYKNTEQLPPFEDYSMKGRTYRYMQEKPLFPFGYGLSYTTFNISGGKLAQSSVKAGEGVGFTVKVQNTGQRDGAEVVQVYVRKVGDTDGPLKSLRAFRRVELKAGESQSVSMELPADTFEFFDTATNTMRIVPGKYEIYYGNSSDMPAQNRLEIQLL